VSDGVLILIAFVVIMVLVGFTEYLDTLKIKYKNQGRHCNGCQCSDVDE
jgi:hypothetical protein